MAPGFRILTRERTISPELVERFRALPVANVSDSAHRLSAAGASLRPMHDGTKMVGAAITVRTRPGDNLMVHKAIDMASPGDVVVVDAGGDLTNAIIGELMSSHAAHRGLAGLVINGAIRDSGEIRAAAFPVYACGVTHRGPYKDGPGEINVPVSIGGMVICAGDLVMGDADGVVAVPVADAEALLVKAEAKHKQECGQLVAIREGRNSRAWVDETLRRLGCEIPL
ncbi:RraA family protein [Paraburkholderia tropica]|uniref:RraA family protein n=1 Tax=Paraburkholderia tropica TaxID=92647 RepID=UPI002AB6FFDB|nr:RraA family protein [Paraburkholderia tropica]